MEKKIGRRVRKGKGNGQKGQTPGEDTLLKLAPSWALAERREDVNKQVPLPLSLFSHTHLARCPPPPHLCPPLSLSMKPLLLI